MRQSSLALALLTLALTAGQAPEPPRQVMRHARAAVEGDSVPAARSAWSERLSRDSSDRAAILGLATMARLTADDSTARPLYRSCSGSSPRAMTSTASTVAWAWRG